MKGALCVQGDSPEMPPGGQDALSGTMPGSPAAGAHPARCTEHRRKCAHSFVPPKPQRMGNLRAAPHKALHLLAVLWGAHTRRAAACNPCTPRTHPHGVHTCAFPHTLALCMHTPARTRLCVHALQAHVCPRMHLAGTLHGECHTQQSRSPWAAPCPLWPSCSLPRPRLNGRKALQRVRAVGNARCWPWGGRRVLQEPCQADLQLQAHSKACTHAQRSPLAQPPSPTPCPRPQDFGAHTALRPSRGTQHNPYGRARSAGGSSKPQTPGAPQQRGLSASRQGEPQHPRATPWGAPLALGRPCWVQGGAGRLPAPAVGRPASSDKGTWPYSQFPARWRVSAQPR